MNLSREKASALPKWRPQTHLVYQQVVKPTKRVPDDPRIPCVTQGLSLTSAGLNQWKPKLERKKLPINHHKHTRRLKGPDWLEWTYTACDSSPGGGRTLKDGGSCKAAWNGCILLLSHDWAMSASQPDINTRDPTFTLSAFMWRLYCHTNAGRHLYRRSCHTHKINKRKNFTAF